MTMKVILDEKMYSLSEVADMLGVTEPTARDYVAKGRMSAVLIGRRKYVSEANIKAFLQAEKK